MKQKFKVLAEQGSYIMINEKKGCELSYDKKTSETIETPIIGNNNKDEDRKKITGENNQETGDSTVKTKDPQKKDSCSGVLGPAGSFSGQAAKILIKEIQGEDFISKSENTMNYYGNIVEVMQALYDEKIDIAIVPIENSTHGTVIDTQKELFKKDFIIKAEIIIPIEHNLLSKGEKKDIKIIASHKQALGQCKKFLEEFKKQFPNVEIKEANSTSEAASMAEKSDGSIAAIASLEAKDQYNLSVLDKNIHDNENNCTRFIIVTNKYSNLSTKEIKIETGKETMFKTSIIVKNLEDRSGSLYDILQIFKEKGINLTRIESQLIEDVGKYDFHIDLDGNIEKDEKIKDAIFTISNLSEVDKLKTKTSIINGNIKDEKVKDATTIKLSEQKEIEFITTIFIENLKDKPGSLCDLLRIFKKEDINLTKIKSQPTGKIGKYNFYIDFNIKDKKAEDVISIIKESKIGKSDIKISIIDKNIKDEKAKDIISATKSSELSESDKKDIEVFIIGSFPVVDLTKKI